MKVSIIGAGYVGLVSGTCLAEVGHSVFCVDIVPEKIEQLQNGKSPIYEPGLDQLLERNIRAERLKFATDYHSCGDAQVIFLVVATPSSEDGRSNLDYLKAAAGKVAESISDGALVVIKSTVPLGTTSLIKELIASKTNKNFYLANNPEFLREGRAIKDFMHPDRIIVGLEDACVREKMDELYAPLLQNGRTIHYMDYLSSEMAKYAANCFLALKISFVNEMARLCDFTGADIEQVCLGMSTDERIGKHFLNPGPGYGGSCFPKDVRALLHTARRFETELYSVKATERANKVQKLYMFEKIKHFFEGRLEGKYFAFWGVAFKAGTDDVRESAAIDMAKALVREGALVNVYDPVASDNFLAVESLADCRKKIQKFDNMYECLKDCDGLVIMTEWEEFKNPDFVTLQRNLNAPVIFDARNLLDTKEVLRASFHYLAIGKRTSL